MSEQIDLEDQEPSASGLRAELEKAQKQAKELAEQNAALARENAISKAGLGELDAIKLKAVTAVHEGDLTPDSLRQTAMSLGYVEEKPEVKPETVAAQQEIEQIRAGAEGGAVSTKDDEIRAARNRQELEAVLAKHNVPMGSVI